LLGFAVVVSDLFDIGLKLVNLAGRDAGSQKER
jgi:hypothetical protein